MLAVPAFQALASMANAMTYDINSRSFLWTSDFAHEYGQGLAAAVQRMSPAELQSVPNLGQHLDDISVAALDLPKAAFKTFNKEVDKRQAH